MALNFLRVPFGRDFMLTYLQKLVEIQAEILVMMFLEVVSNDEMQDVCRSCDPLSQKAHKYHTSIP